MKKVFCIFIVLQMLFCMMSIAFGDIDLSEKPEAITKIKYNESDIDELIKEEMKQSKIPGMAVAIIKDGEILYKKCFGYADLENKIEVDENTYFEIGSNSKAFTAFVINKLILEGKVDRNDKITKYIPWFKAYYNNKVTDITIDNLLTHKSGIPFKSIDSIPESNSENAIEETIKAIDGVKLTHKPGEHYEYATINYDFLGYVIQKVSGTSYENYMMDIFKSLGLNNTYADNSYDKENKSKGYMINFSSAKEYNAPVYRGNKPAGYIISTIDDMIKWADMQINYDNLSTENKDVFLQYHDMYKSVDIETPMLYNNGWMYIYDNGKFIEHGGNNPNYSSNVVTSPEENMAIVVLSNLNSNYTQTTCFDIYRQLHGSNKRFNMGDLNITADNICTIGLIVCGIVCLLLAFGVVKCIIEIRNHKRIRKEKSYRVVLEIIIFTILIAALWVVLYIAPAIFYNGVTWGFVFVWLPITVKYFVLTVALTILMSYALLILLSVSQKVKKIKNNL